VLGWHISVHRLTDPALRETGADAEAALAASALGERLAVWQAGLAGLQWIDDLAAGGQGRTLLGGGYPSRYLIRARELVPRILAGPPAENTIWIVGPNDILGPGWLGKTTVDEDALRSCPPEEWLLVEVWDES
jgi:hypothetical protein